MKHALARWSLPVIAFFFASVIDVRVRAASIEQPVELPPHCWARVAHLKPNAACAYLNNKQKILMHMPFGELRMSPEASLILHAKKTLTLHLVRGVFWIRATQPILIKTLYADSRVTRGQVLIDAQDRHINIINLTSDLRYWPRGNGKGAPLPKAMAVSIGRVSSSGVARTGFPHAPSAATLFHVWTRVYAQSDMPELKGNVREFLPSWARATQEVGPWYAQIVQREIASAEQEKKNQARQRAKRQSEIKKLRDMFRAQNYVN